MNIFDTQATTFLPAERKSLLKNTVTPDTNAQAGYSPYQKGALSILGETLQGISAAYSGDNQWSQRQRKLDQEQQQIDNEAQNKIAMQNMAKNDPQKLLKDLEAKAQLTARLKQMNNQPLTDFEKDVIGYKDPNQPPSDMEVYRTAYNTAVTKLGGSSMVGLSPDRTAALESTVQAEYLNLKKQFGTETPQEKAQRAKMYLKQQGYAASDEFAKQFLQKNKGF